MLVVEPSKKLVSYQGQNATYLVVLNLIKNKLKGISMQTENSVTPPPPPPPPTSLKENTMGDERTMTLVTLSIQLSSLLLGITGLIALIMAYIFRSSSESEVAKSHYSQIIGTFWISFLLIIVGFFTMFFGIGIIILIGTAIWVLYRSIRSLIRAASDKPY